MCVPFVELIVICVVECATYVFCCRVDCYKCVSVVELIVCMYCVVELIVIQYVCFPIYIQYICFPFIIQCVFYRT